MSTPPKNHQALVIGGSMAGLLAGRVLADYFEQVTIVERDHFPDGPEFRKGIPQARHVHVLLKRGEQALERFFPGLGDELTAAGVPVIDWTADTLALGARGWLPRFPSGIVGHSPSRDLLEWSIRRRLRQDGRVQFLEAHDAIGLLSSADKTAVAGVKIRARNEAEHAPGEERDLPADFVVDASGRDSRLPAWLESLGYVRPQETVINSFMGYASRIYQRPSDTGIDWKVLLLARHPPQVRHGGVIYELEGNRWIVTLAGAPRDYPPTDEAGFLEFARTLASPKLYEAIKDAQPLSPIYGFRKTENHLRYYERLARWPEGLVVTGDALCAFNPVYGQGMSVAALDAETLEQALREQQARYPAGDLTGLARRAQRALAKAAARSWQTATSADFRYPETEGGKASGRDKLLYRYGDGVRALAGEDRAVYRTFIEVAHLLKPSSALLKPGIALRVLSGSANKQKSVAAL
jgi:2-polyprenyl-6-methoxyphenol hydroxylase-like FAD-dependent oxidoreductase